MQPALFSTVTPRQLGRLFAASVAYMNKHEAQATEEHLLQHATRHVLEILDARDARRRARVSEILMRDE